MFKTTWGFTVTVIGEENPIITAFSDGETNVDMLQVLKNFVEAKSIKALCGVIKDKDSEKK